jgi:hypothetical protein
LELLTQLLLVEVARAQLAIPLQMALTLFSQPLLQLVAVRVEHLLMVLQAVLEAVVDIQPI